MSVRQRRLELLTYCKFADKLNFGGEQRSCAPYDTPVPPTTLLCPQRHSCTHTVMLLMLTYLQTFKSLFVFNLQFLLLCRVKTLFAALPCLWYTQARSSRQCYCNIAYSWPIKPFKQRTIANAPLWPRKVTFSLKYKHSWGNIKIHSGHRMVLISY